MILLSHIILDIQIYLVYVIFLNYAITKRHKMFGINYRKLMKWKKKHKIKMIFLWITKYMYRLIGIFGIDDLNLNLRQNKYSSIVMLNLAEERVIMFCYWHTDFLNVLFKIYFARTSNYRKKHLLKKNTDIGAFAIVIIPPIS